MLGHGESSAGSHLVDPTSPIPSHGASIVATSTLRVNPHRDLKKANDDVPSDPVRARQKQYYDELWCNINQSRVPYPSGTLETMDRH